MSASVVKGNRPLRMFAIGVLIVLAVAQFMGQIDLTEVSFLWLLILMALNALQASFSGFCPMFKNAKGECVACGVACDSNQTELFNENSPAKCCGGEQTSSCCDSDKTASSAKKDDGCCGTSCCGESDCVAIKVLGTGCQTCDNAVKLIEETARNLGVTVCVTKVTDIAEIAAYGVMATPGIVINDQVVHSGSMPTREQVLAWLQVK